MAAGVFIPVYLAFGFLAFWRGFYDIATLMLVIMGTTIAYLWYNIAPAKFIMGDTGTVGVLLTLGVTAMLIDYLYLLPIAGIMLVVTVTSALIQVLSKKILKRKVFLAAPFHHHLEAIGWTKGQITIRYWLISWVFSIIAVIIGVWLG